MENLSFIISINYLKLKYICFLREADFHFKMQTLKTLIKDYY